MPTSIKHRKRMLQHLEEQQVHRPFDVSIDHERKTIRIQGINYSFELFDVLAFSDKGARFEIGERQDGVVTLHTLPRAN